MTPAAYQTLPLDVALQQAIAHHQAGRLQNAESIYRAILQAQPNHPDANHNLGVLAVQAKQPATALPLFKAALDANPNQGQYWASYIEALLQAGQTDAARRLLARGRRQGLSSDIIQILTMRLKGGARVAEQSGAEHQHASGESLPALSSAQQSTNKKSKSRKSADHPKKDPNPQEINTLVALVGGGQYTEAANLAQAMTVRFPLHGFGWQALGIVFMQMGRNADALLAMQKAVVLSPNNSDAHSNLGGLLNEVGRLDESEAICRRALEIQPDLVEAHSNLGKTLKDMDRLDESALSYRRALEVRPDIPEVHNNLSDALKKLGQLDESEASCRRALEINPNFAEAHHNLGAILTDMGRFKDAETSYRRALQIKPDFAKTHSNLGVTLHDMGRLDEAEASYRRALEIKPDYAEAYSNLGNTLKDMGKLEEAEASYRQALGIKPDYFDTYSNLLFIRNYLSDISSTVMLDEARKYGQTVADKVKTRFSDWTCSPHPKRLRVGLVSGDLHSHPVGYFLESILTHLDQSKIDLFAYPTHHKADELTARIKPCFGVWKPLFGKSDEAAARMIRSDALHILVDLSGHTEYNRLPVFAWKPAPVQVSWLGYFATTGVAAIDYLLADPWVLPEPEETYFTEKIWRLPETRLCFTPPNVDVEVSPLPALCNGYVTLGCFNNLAKMNDDVVALWARILVSIPDSRLFLKAGQLKEASVRQNTIDRFAVHGISADRLVLEGSESREKYLAAYHRVDIALDPFPFPGGTTSVEGLWMGVPVLTLAGERFLSRQGVGILMNAGLPEWIASGADDYVTRAVAHAKDLRRLSDLRGGLRQQILASPLFDANRFARHFEAALGGMWQAWRDKQGA